MKMIVNKNKYDLLNAKFVTKSEMADKIVELLVFVRKINNSTKLENFV